MLHEKLIAYTDVVFHRKSRALSFYMRSAKPSGMTQACEISEWSYAKLAKRTELCSQVTLNVLLIIKNKVICRSKYNMYSRDNGKLPKMIFNYF